MNDPPDYIEHFVKVVIMNDYDDIIKELRDVQDSKAFSDESHRSGQAADAIEELVVLRERDRHFNHLMREQMSNRIEYLEKKVGFFDDLCTKQLTRIAELEAVLKDILEEGMPFERALKNAVKALENK